MRGKKLKPCEERAGVSSVCLFQHLKSQEDAGGLYLYLVREASAYENFGNDLEVIFESQMEFCRSSRYGQVLEKHGEILKTWGVAA